jgi:CheY-like chemotaxis protein
MVIALTGDDDPEKRRQCLEAGCADVMIKPVPARQLMAVAEKVGGGGGREGGGGR